MTGPEPLVVVGDVLLDEDIEGVATRLAPDAPAPVVDVTGDHRHPGGDGLDAARHDLSDCGARVGRHHPV